MKKQKTKYLKIFLLVLAAIGLIVWLILWGRSSGEGKVLRSPDSKAPTAYVDKQLVGRYISFTYSGRYMARTEAAKDNDLERYTLSADTRHDKRILASVSNLPDGKLESDGSYIYRQKATALYTSRKVQVGEHQSVTVWAKKDGTEQTAIMAHGNRVATVSLVTTNTSEDLTAETNALLKSFRWK